MLWYAIFISMLPLDLPEADTYFRLGYLCSLSYFSPLYLLKPAYFIAGQMFFGYLLLTHSCFLWPACLPPHYPLSTHCIWPRSCLINLADVHCSLSISHHIFHLSTLRSSTFELEVLDHNVSVPEAVSQKVTHWFVTEFPVNLWSYFILSRSPFIP